ncbi:MAG: hypothetical protein V9E94_11105 [Microthrixaceae bacterium]
MLRFLGTWVLARLFGDGLGADLAARGVVYLADGAMEAVERPEERLGAVRLRPGDTYTVIARPPATRRERRLAARQRALRDRDRRLRRPNRRQYRAARRLERTQIQMEKARPGGGRATRLGRREAARGARFDKLTTPTRRQRRVSDELSAVTVQLDAARSVSFERAAARRPRPRRRGRVHVYD